jgi:hypothetical protein
MRKSTASSIFLHFLHAAQWQHHQKMPNVGPQGHGAPETQPFPMRVSKCNSSNGGFLIASSQSSTSMLSHVSLTEKEPVSCQPVKEPVLAREREVRDIETEEREEKDSLNLAEFDGAPLRLVLGHHFLSVFICCRTACRRTEPSWASGASCL